MRILIIDDSADARALLQAHLRAAGYDDLLTAESAVDAFRHRELNDPAAPPALDLILMDVDMPQIGGIDACGQIKEMPHLADVPIIMITGRTATEDLQAAFAAGAVDYLTKPVGKGELLARVRSALRLKREMDARKVRERELAQRTGELERALGEVKALQGCLPLCAGCKKNPG